MKSSHAIAAWLLERMCIDVALIIHGQAPVVGRFGTKGDPSFQFRIPCAVMVGGSDSVS